MKTKLIWSVLCILSPTPLHWHCNNILMGATNANRMSNSWASQNTPLGSQGIELEDPIVMFECFSLKAVYNSCKLQRLLQVAKFLFMYFFAHTNSLPTYWNFHLHKRLYKMKYLSGDSISFFRSRFCQYCTYFFDFMWSSNKVFKDIKIFWTVHSRPLIRYQGKDLDLFWIWCCF